MALCTWVIRYEWSRCKITIYPAHRLSGSGIRTAHSGDDLSLLRDTFEPQPETTRAGDCVQHLRPSPSRVWELRRTGRLGPQCLSACASVGFVTAHRTVAVSHGRASILWKKRTRQNLDNLESHAVILLRARSIEAITEACASPGAGGVDSHPFAYVAVSHGKKSVWDGMGVCGLIFEKHGLPPPTTALGALDNVPSSRKAQPKRPAAVESLCTRILSPFAVFPQDLTPEPSVEFMALCHHYCISFIYF